MRTHSKLSRAAATVTGSLVVLGAFAIGAPRAHADVPQTNWVGGGQYTFFVGDDTVNDVTVTQVDGMLVFRDARHALTARNGCTSAGNGAVKCPAADTSVSLFGLGGDDILRGGPESGDRVIGGAGNDDLWGGGGGADYVSYTGDPTRGTGVTVTIDNVANDGTPGAEFDNVHTDVEGATGTDFADTLVGSGADDLIDGWGGDDDVRGLGGNDWLGGQYGNDVLAGGDGNDLFYGGPGRDDIQGGLGADDLHGEDGDDVFDGGPGGAGDSGDVIRGGNGQDWVSYYGHSRRGVTVTVDGRANDGERSPRENDNVMTDVEDVTGTRFDDTITGSDAANMLFGTEGRDTIRGGRGDDQVFGEAGVDRLYGGAGNDGVIANDGERDRVLSGGAGADWAYVDFGDPAPGQIEDVVVS